jgi:sarcosine oxidase, subunit beta
MSTVEVDVTIVGGGLTGCAAAYYLRKRGRSVVLLERGFVGGESSGVNFGSLRLQGHHLPELPLALRAQELWERIEAVLGESVEFVQHGHVHVALNDDHVGIMERFAKNARPYGLDVQLLDQREAVRRWPFLSQRVIAASWSPRDAVVNSRLVSPAFARAALALGAVIHEQTEVTAVEHDNDRFVTRTATGLTVRSPNLINAAGVWGGTLAHQFGEETPVFPAGPVQIITEPIVPFVAPVIHAVDGSVLFRQTPRGNVLIAGHPRITVDAQTRRTRVPPAKMATNMARLISIAPHMRAHHVIRTWTGIEGYMPDMLPAFGPSETMPGLFHAFAFSGHGLQIGPAIGTILAELIIDGGTQTPIDLFRIGRFRSPVVADHGALAQEFYDDVLQKRPNN